MCENLPRAQLFPQPNGVLARVNDQYIPIPPEQVLSMINAVRFGIANSSEGFVMYGNGIQYCIPMGEIKEIIPLYENGKITLNLNNEPLPPLPENVLRVREDDDVIQEGDVINTEETINYNQAQPLSKVVKNRINNLFQSILYDQYEDRVTIKSRVSQRRKEVYKPRTYNKYEYLFNNEQVTEQDQNLEINPKIDQDLMFKPNFKQESYPVYTYATYGIPNTFVLQHAPEDIIRIKPEVDFEINAKPRPILVSQAHVLLLSKLLSEVFKWR